MKSSVFFWRRTDVDGLERLVLSIESEKVMADASVICLEAGGLRLDHHWRLDPGWSVQSAEFVLWNPKGQQVLHIERAGAGWRVNGTPRPDLDGADEPDLSVTPFCNTFPIRRTPDRVGGSLTLETAVVDGPTLVVARSRQRYDRQGPGRLRYIDLGLSRGFERILSWTRPDWC